MSSMNKLVTLSLLGAGSCAGMILLFRRKLSETIKQSAHYKEAISLVRNHEGAKQILGEPIKDSEPEIINKTLTFTGISESKVNVLGSKASGVVFITLIGDSMEDIKLDSIQLQVGLDKSKRLVIKESTRDTGSEKS